jgi:multidrug efflux pump subunit AcrA (membrane-fusion protein)
MKTVLILAVVVVLAIATYTASRLHERLQPPDDQAGHQPEDTDLPRDATPEEPAVHVRVVRSRRGVLPNTIVVLGTVVPGPDMLQAVSATTDLRLVRVLVSSGDHVHAGSPVAEAELTAETRSARQSALSERDQARIALGSARERLNRQLSTRQEVEQAQQALAASEPRAALWDALGGVTPFIITASRDGTVDQVMAHGGQVLASGSVICEVIGPGIEGRLGFEPRLSGCVHPLDQMRISFPAVIAQAGTPCPVRAVSPRIEPDTHLLDVLVSLPDGAAPLGALVRGELSVTTPSGWLVPRAAVDPTDAGDSLFTIADGKAHEHHLTVLASSNEVMSVVADDLADGDEVAILGNAELHDGSAVIVDR